MGGKVLLDAGGEVEGDIVEVAAGSIGSFMHDFDHRFKWYYPWFFRSFSLIVLLLVSLVAVLLFPSIIEKASYQLESNPGKSMLFGILIMILFIPFIVILAISLLGIPLIPILVIFYFLAYFLGYMAVGKVLGQRILVSLDRGPNTLIFRIFLGVVTIWVISLIPVIGGLLNLMIFVIGLGVLILSIKKGTDKVTQSSA